MAGAGVAAMARHEGGARRTSIVGPPAVALFVTGQTADLHSQELR